jgi:Glycosyl hydrolase family 92
VIARNLDSQYLNRYVQSATLNGQPLENNWFRHDQIANGGTLILNMGSAPTGWGTKVPPPSLSDPVSPLCTEASASEASPQPLPSSSDGSLKLSHIQVIGTHDSYHAGDTRDHLDEAVNAHSKLTRSVTGDR